MTKHKYFGEEMKAIAASLVNSKKPDQKVRAKLGVIMEAAGNILIEIEKTDWGQEHQNYEHMINSWLFDNDLIPEDALTLIESSKLKPIPKDSKLELNLKVLDVLLKSLLSAMELAQSQIKNILERHKLE